MTTLKMTADPNPTTQGGTVEVCYDTSGVTLPITLTVNFDPSGSETVTINSDDVDGEGKYCWTINVPSDCTGITVVDESGNSEDLGITVNPNEGV